MTRAAACRIGSSIVALALWLGVSTRAAPPQAEADRLIAASFDAAYNLDHEQGMTLVRKAVAVAPDESRTHRALASLLWLDILFQRGAVTVDHFLGGVTKSQLNLPKPLPALDAEFHQALDKSIALASRRVAAEPRNIDAEDDLGTAYGLQASYSASVDGSLTAAFKSARRAYDAEEHVLERDPSRAGAGLVVGTYRYVVAGMALPSRLFAYMMGFGGGKEQGIALLEAAAKNAERRTEAQTALVLIYTREGRHLDAVRILRDLEREYPRNRLFVLEEGASLIRAGKFADADGVLTRGLAAFDLDPRRKIPGERPLWLYKRGVARVAANRPADARADLDTALATSPVEWVRGRIHLELGKLADRAGRRDSALASYKTARAIAEASNDPWCAAAAARYTRTPFGPVTSPQTPHPEPVLFRLTR